MAFRVAAGPGWPRPAVRRLADWLDPAQPRFKNAQPAEDWQALSEEAVRREIDGTREDGKRSSS